MMNYQNDKRSAFDWIMFILIHIIFFAAIAWAGVKVYGESLGAWVAASAAIEALALTYLFHKVVPGETLMKVLLYFFASLNVAYLVHNGAQKIGIQLYNDGQVKKYEIGVREMAAATSRRIASTIGASAENASKLDKMFGDEVAIIASILAFLSLFAALCVFALASRRSSAPQSSPATVGEFSDVETVERFNGTARPKDH